MKVYFLSPEDASTIFMKSPFFCYLQPLEINIRTDGKRPIVYTNTLNYDIKDTVEIKIDDANDTIQIKIDDGDQSDQEEQQNK